MELQKRKETVEKTLCALHNDENELKDGRLSVSEKMRLLFDSQSFAETNALISSSADILSDKEKCLEGVLTGYGAVEGRLCYAYAQDYSRMSGALGLMGAKKIAEAYKNALKNGAPMIAVFDCDGVKLNEGVNVLAAFSVVLDAVANAKGKIPLISVITGVCSGINAVIAMQSDFIISAGEKCELSISPLSVVKQASGGNFSANEYKKLFSLDCASEQEAFLNVRALLSYLPSNKKDDCPVITGDDPERVTPEIEELVCSSYDMRSLLKILADGGKFLELNEKNSCEMITAICSVGTFSCGIVATNPAVNEGRLTAEGCEKASSFIDFCSRFNLPLLSVGDCAGYDASAEAAQPCAINSYAKLSQSFACFKAPFVSLISGKMSGSVFSFFGSKFLGADMVFALKNAEIELMPSDSAVQFMFGERLKTETAEELKTKWEQEISTPLEAASCGLIDFICEYSELRARIASAFSMLAQKKKFADFLS